MTIMNNALNVARKGASVLKSNARGLVVAGAVIASTVAAQAQETDYGATLNTNFTVIDTIWGKVATIMIAVALVTVGVRFFRKAK